MCGDGVNRKTPAPTEFEDRHKNVKYVLYIRRSGLYSFMQSELYAALTTRALNAFTMGNPFWGQIDLIYRKRF